MYYQIPEYNYWKNKKIVWFGTSIPETGYPQVVGTKLGATIYNEALSSSMARAFKYTGSMVGLDYQNCLRSLSQTIAEKQSIMDYWSSGLNASGVVTSGGTYGWKDLLIGSPPTDYTTFATAATILSWSYENKLVAKYLNSSDANYVAAPDLFVFDHGYNDLNPVTYDADDASAIAIPSTRNDRSFYCGAMNYLIDLIFTYNPRARICFIGHYENARKTRIYQAQEVLTAYWDFPLCKTWELTGWSQQTITTTGYWSDSTTWVSSGGSSRQLTMTQVWLQDDVHPVSTPTQFLLAEIIADFLATIR